MSEPDDLGPLPKVEDVQIIECLRPLCVTAREDAAAEIRGLRADNAKLCRWKVRYGRRIKSLEADNADLRESLKDAI